MQISGHLSVQSSSTFRSRKEETPIYLFRFKKIEQGQLLYPKICPLYFKTICFKRSPHNHRVLQLLKGTQGCIRQSLLLSNGLQIRVLSFSKEIGLPRPQVDFIVSHISQSSSMSSFKPHSAKLLSQLLK